MVELRDLNIIMRSPVDWEKFRDKTVLVTGATGRLGMYIVEVVSKANIDWNLNMTIILSVRNREKAVSVFGHSIEFPFVHLLVNDITEPIIWDGRVDYIFHTAGLASPQDFTERPVETLWGHLQGTRNVLELAREKHTERVIYISTVEVYGNWQSDAKVTENDMGPMYCDNARACYPEAKRMCETMLASYEAQYGVKYNILRLCHTFGPGISLNDGRAFAEFMRNVLDGKDIVLQSDGSAVRTYTYVADAVGAMLLVATKGEDKVYNVAAPDNLISIKDLAHLIADLMPEKNIQVKVCKENKSHLKYLPFKLAIMDVSRLEKLGWQPYVGIRDAFKYTMEYYMQQR